MTDISGNGDLDLITAKEASELIGVSVTTFRKMRGEPKLAEIEVKIGQRVKYPKAKLLALYKMGTRESVAEARPNPKAKLCIFADGTTPLYESNSKINLTNFILIDPYGSLALLVHLIERSRNGLRTELIVNDGDVCKELRYVGFFNHLEAYAPLVTWNRMAFGNSNYISAQSLLPITVIKRKGEERRVVEQLLQIFVQHGFSEQIGGYIGWMLGELGDNCLTHSNPVISDRVCFMQAQRYSLGDSTNCVIVAIADLGEGIHTTLKTNPKHSGLSDREAFLSAFRHKYSCWSDEHKRGKGLTDMLAIAIGNHSFFRASNGDIDFIFNFYNKEIPVLTEMNPTLVEGKGAKFGFVLIDKEFTPVHRDEADVTLKKEIEKWKK